MTGIDLGRRKARTTSGLLCVVAIGIIAFALTGFSNAFADDESGLSEDDETCLACHQRETFEKKLTDGTTLSLHVSAEEFAGSVHAPLGCSGCHSDVDLEEHPGKKREIANARKFSREMVAVCQPCHAAVFKQYEGSTHANLLRQGNQIVPVCTDCHGSHEVTPKTAYNTCIGCHASAMAKHSGWLPNASLHLEVVSCAACHASGAKRMVDLRLYDSVKKDWVVEPTDHPYFEKAARAADSNGDGLDATELRALMSRITPDGVTAPFILRGRVELQKDIESHQLVDPAHAIKVCASCHRRGAEPFEKVNVSIVEANGKPLRYEAHKDVLSSAQSVQSLREFYAVGGTRNVLLDALLLLAVIGGVMVPVGHQTLKWIVKRGLLDAATRDTKEPQEEGKPSTGDDADR